MKIEQKDNKYLMTSVLNVILYLIMLIVNFLANALPINGKNTGEISESYLTLFAPAGYTFSIWGLIYLMLLAFVIYSLYIAFTRKNIEGLTWQTNMFLGLNFLLNSLWIFAWHYEMIELSVIIMLMLLGTLIFLFMETNALKTKKITQDLVLKVPISIYLGWISVATIANISAYLVTSRHDLSFLSESMWVIIMLFTAVFLGILMIKRHANKSFVLILIWAFVGIAQKRQNDEVLHVDIIYVAYFSIIILALLVLTQIDFKKRT